MKITKNTLHNRFTKSFDALGAYYGDDETGLTEEEYVAAGHDPQWFQETALLPGGGSLGICTHGAHYVIKTLGQGARYGFHVEDNPSVTDSTVINAGGHDFALIEGRYIVDPWYALTINGQGVFDLESAADRKKAQKIYGSTDCWMYFDPIAEEQITMSSPDLPAEAFVRSLKARDLEDQGMCP
jgi:hypothetical protein